jgi:hypothetical protein
METERSEKQDEKAASPKSATLQPDSNVRSESLEQQLKQHSEMVSMDDGMQID